MVTLILPMSLLLLNAFAEDVLQRLWQEQPDADAAAQPLPYSGLLRELFATDPYYEVDAVPSSSSSSSGSGMCVGLRVSKIKEMLNW